MNDLDELSREDLWNLARDWRCRSLRGDRTAHGPAHLCEATWRRRFGPAPLGRPAAGQALALLAMDQRCMRPNALRSKCCSIWTPIRILRRMLDIPAHVTSHSTLERQRLLQLGGRLRTAATQS